MDISKSNSNTSRRKHKYWTQFKFKNASRFKSETDSKFRPGNHALNSGGNVINPIIAGKAKSATFCWQFPSSIGIDCPFSIFYLKSLVFVYPIATCIMKTSFILEFVGNLCNDACGARPTPAVMPARAWRGYMWAEGSWRGVPYPTGPKFVHCLSHRKAGMVRGEEIGCPRWFYKHISTMKASSWQICGGMVAFLSHVDVLGKRRAF